MNNIWILVVSGNGLKKDIFYECEKTIPSRGAKRL